MFGNDFELDGDLGASEEIQRELLNIDRINVYDIENDELEEILAQLSNEDKIKLFDRIVERIKSTPEERYGNNHLILSLPPEIRIKYVEYYDFETNDAINELIDGMTNEDDIYDTVRIGLNKIKNKEYVKKHYERCSKLGHEIYCSKKHALCALPRIGEQIVETIALQQLHNPLLLSKVLDLLGYYRRYCGILNLLTEKRYRSTLERCELAHH